MCTILSLCSVRRHCVSAGGVGCREVLPQAACTKYGLAVGAHAAWFVKLLMVLTSPIAYPCSLLLDLALGSHRSVIPFARIPSGGLDC